MKKRIQNYLSSKETEQHTALDRVFEAYLNGEIKTLLLHYDSVGIYPSFGKREKSFQIQYQYHNICVIIDFFENSYNMVIYPEGAEVDEFERLSTDYNYSDDFTVKQLLQEVDTKIKQHPKLRNTATRKKKKKLYSLFSWISFLFPIFVFGCLALYYAITGTKIVIERSWGILLFLISWTVCIVFEVKSKRLY